MKWLEKRLKTFVNDVPDDSIVYWVVFGWFVLFGVIYYLVKFGFLFVTSPIWIIPYFIGVTKGKEKK